MKLISLLNLAKSDGRMSLAILIYAAIFPVVIFAIFNADPALVWWEFALIIVAALFIIGKSFVREQVGRGRVSPAQFKQRLWPAFWQVQKLALGLSAVFGLALFANFYLGIVTPDLDSSQRIGRAALLTYLLYWFFVLDLMRKTASWPAERFVPTLKGIWNLKWAGEVISLLVIVTLIFGGQFLFSDKAWILQDNSSSELMFALIFLVFLFVASVIDKGQPCAIPD